MADNKKKTDERINFTKEDFMRRSDLPMEKATIQSRENLKKSGIVDKNGYVKESYVDLAKEFQEKDNS